MGVGPKQGLALALSAADETERRAASKNMPPAE
jgi:hypothetical protein